jgi:hypothetical protein
MYSLNSWAEFKTLCTSKKLQMQFSELDDRVLVIGPDFNGINWNITLFKKLEGDVDNPDYIDFDTNFRSLCNRSIECYTADGLVKGAVFPGVDSTMMCFMHNVTKQVSISNSLIEWQVPYSYIQLSGVKAIVSGAELLDGISMSVGYYVNDTWTTITDYTDGGITFIETKWELDIPNFGVKTNPIPQGLYLRAAYAFANTQTTNQPLVSITYFLWRSYAQ